MDNRNSYTITDIELMAKKLLEQHRDDKVILADKVHNLVHSLPVNISQKVTAKNGYYFTLEDDTE